MSPPDETGDVGVHLPRNVEAEAALLGALMIDNRLIDDVEDSLDPKHFFEPVHGRIFSAIKALRATGGLATPITLRPMFEADEGIGELGGPSYLGRLTGSGAGLIGARQFAKQIYDLAQLRALVAVGRALIEGATDTADEVNPQAQIDRAELLLAEVSASGNDETPAVPLAKAWDAAMRKIENVAAGKVERGIVIPEFVEWNDICGGSMTPGQLILLGGRPGMGKTAIALTVARRTAEAGNGVLFISREMPVDQLMMRIVTDMLFEAGSGVTLDDVLAGRLGRQDYERAQVIRDRIADWPLVFEEPASLNAARISRIVRRHKRDMARRGKKLGLVVVDYLGLLEPPQRRGNREQEIGDISRELKNAARAGGVAVLALAQLNRAVEQREDKRPLLSDLRDSGSLEQDADTVVFAYRAEYYLRQSEPKPDHKTRADWEAEMTAERDQLDVYSSKVRQGAPQRRKVHFFGARQAIRNGDYFRTGGTGGLA